MKNLGIALAVVALVTIPVAAASPWTTYESSYSYHTIWWYYDGQYYSGTVSYGWSYQWKDNGNNYLRIGESWYTFEADDGSLVYDSWSKYNDKWGYDSADNYTSTSHWKYSLYGKVVEKGNGLYHYTYNANGELVSFKFK